MQKQERGSGTVVARSLCMRKVPSSNLGFSKAFFSFFSPPDHSRPYTIHPRAHPLHPPSPAPPTPFPTRRRSGWQNPLSIELPLHHSKIIRSNASCFLQRAKQCGSALSHPPLPSLPLPCVHLHHSKCDAISFPKARRATSQCDRSGLHVRVQLTASHSSNPEQPVAFSVCRLPI